MVRSDGTASTRISSNLTHGKPPLPPGHANGNTIVVAQRSIGVQRSVQTTPRMIRSARETPMPTASIASMEMEYDYYDYDVPISGGILKPTEEIDIEKIVAMETSGWLEERPKP